MRRSGAVMFGRLYGADETGVEDDGVEDAGVDEEGAEEAGADEFCGAELVVLLCDVEAFGSLYSISG